MSKEILTLDEAAELLSISPRSLREAAARGEVPAQKLARQWRFSRFALHQWLSGEGTHPFLKHAGAMADNPLWDEVQAAIEAERADQRRASSQERAQTSVK